MIELLERVHAGLPSLALLQVLPLLGAALLLRLGERPVSLVLGHVFPLAELMLALHLYRVLDVANPSFQFVERLHLAGPLTYHAGADGITVLFMVLTALTIALLPFYVRVRGLEDQARLLALLLAIEGLMMSLLVTLDLLWFCLASGVELALVGYLVTGWGDAVGEPVGVWIGRHRFRVLSLTGIPSERPIAPVSMRMPSCFASSAMLSSSAHGAPRSRSCSASTSCRSTCAALSTTATRSTRECSRKCRTMRSSSEKPCRS
jgi:hypothetical protein